MANLERPRYIEIVGGLPRNATGNALEPALRARAAQRLES
jgi:acyl-CoA synthetase (AMP-forming)/AMP-acid ligase II